MKILLFLGIAFFTLVLFSGCVETVKDECSADTDCNDGEISTQDKCEGTPKKCSNVPITSCVTGDDYCPQNCDFVNDEDCEMCPEAKGTKSKNQCIIDLAREKADPSICEFYTPMTLGTFEIHYTKGFCYYHYATAQTDTVICDQLADKIEMAKSADAKQLSKEETVNICKQTIIDNSADETVDQQNFDRAVDEKDESYCGKIVDSFNRKLCYARLAEVKNDLTLCEKTIAPESCKLDVLEITKNIADCTEITDTDLKTMCFAILTPDMDKCEEIGSDPLTTPVTTYNPRKECFLRYAELNEDKMACYKLSLMKDVCLYGVAEKKKDRSICEEIASEFWREGCIEKTGG